MSINSPANQHTNDEREQICWDFYVESVVAGTPNATESALKAGYSPDHSRNITIQGWFKERLDGLRRRDMLSKAEKKLDRTLEYEPVDSEGNVKVDLLRVQTDVAKHVTNTLGKQHYSTKGEDAQEKMADNVRATAEQVAIAKRYEDELKDSMK